MIKKIINGKLYNTETATCLASFHNGKSTSDFRHLSESIYRKRTGEYFLSGYGGAMTHYAVPVDNMWGAGSGITPLTLEEAKEWAEQHMSVDEYIEEFGEVEE